MHDSIKTITGSVKRFFSGTLLSRMTGAGRDVLIAGAFGVHPSLAAFFMAYRFAYLLRRVLGEGAMQAAFVPRFEGLRKEGEVSAVHFYREVVWSVALLLLGLIGLSEVGLGASLWLGVWNPNNAEVVRLTMLMLPATLFLCLFAINGSVLQCQQRYFLPAFAPVLFNLVWIGAVLAFWGWNVTSAMPYLAGGIVTASIVQWGVTHYWCRRCLVWEKRAVRPFSPEVRALGKALGIGIIGVGAVQFNGASDQLFARWADPSGPAFLWYAFRIVQAPISLFGVALGGAVLPPLARALKEGNEEKYRKFLNFGLRSALLLVLPCSIGFLAVGDGLAGLIYGRGEFGANAFGHTMLCVWGYAIGMGGTAMVAVLAPAHYARGEYFKPMWGALASVFLNIVLNGVFVFGLGFGVWGVALATGISGWLNAGWLFLGLKGVDRIGVFNQFVRVAVMSFVAALVVSWVAGEPHLMFLQLREELVAMGALDKLGVLLRDAAVFVGVFMVLKWRVGYVHQEVASTASGE